MRYRTAFLSLLALCCVSIMVHAAPPDATPVRLAGQALRASPLDRLLVELREDPAAMASLARAALDEMLRDYDVEIDRVERQLRAGAPVPAETYTWYRGAIATRNDLGAIREQMTAGMTIDAIAEAGGNTRLLLDGRSVMIDTPRLSAKADLQQRIANRTCEVVDCVTAATEVAVAARGRSAPGTWSFGDRRAPAYESGTSGVQCLFQDNAHLLLKKQACERVLLELEQVSTALRELHERGGFVDWQQMTILPATSGAHRLVVDSHGNFVALSLPSLHRLGEQFERVRPWLRARSSGETETLELMIENRFVYAMAAIEVLPR
ncbi:MAG: hypothetical protein IT494_08635 [Gammaproteobacteria bacterium]|nr:hypothetical protein [Gammaproteobacteria bacterium]